jgi:hypothetical protein
VLGENVFIRHKTAEVKKEHLVNGIGVKILVKIPIGDVITFFPEDKSIQETGGEIHPFLVGKHKVLQIGVGETVKLFTPPTKEFKDVWAAAESGKTKVVVTAPHKVPFVRFFGIGGRRCPMRDEDTVMLVKEA